MNLALNRRHLLAGAGALTVSVVLPGAKARAGSATQASRLALKPDQLATYISINQDGSAVGWVGKIDMGQGTDIGWIKMIAEELDLPPERVSMVQGHTDLTADQGGASGSTGIWKTGAAMRNAAAEDRRVLVPPVAGAVPVAVDEASVKDTPGVQVVWQKGFIGLVAPKEWDAVRAAKALKITWSDVKPPFAGNAGLYDHIRSAKIAKKDEEDNVGNVDAAFANAAKVVEATYEWPFHSHAPMAPACGVADVRNGEATIWTGSPKPPHCPASIPQMLRLDA